MARILVTEEIAETGLELLRSSGHEVDIQTGKSPEEIHALLPGAAALIIRSATTVTPEMLDAGTDLIVVGRAGIGLDNVDVEYATKRGVMVCNAPQSNIITTAEQTLNLIMAQARNTAAADASVRAGKWERSKFTGMELHGKTLGIVGLGRVGALVAERAKAFGMNLIAHDPFVSADRARELSVELVTLDELAAQADVVTLHVIKTPETLGLIGADFFAKAKDGIRIVNVARGGVIDEDALADALESGKVAAAGLDVFASEPLGESRLRDFPNVTLAPHLGASTAEAQLKAGVTIAEQVQLALANEFVPFAVNIDAAEVAGILKPYLPLAEELGALFASMVGELPSEIEVVFEGKIGGYDASLATLAASKGMLCSGDDPVSFVNVGALLDEQGVSVKAVSSTASNDFVNLLSIRGGGRELAATLFGLRQAARIVMVDGHDVDVPPRDQMLLVSNDDRPGMIGQVGTILGDAGVNIDDMDVGRTSAHDNAVMVIAVDRPVPAEVVAALKATDGILSVDAISLCS
ncbi:MAG: phosphoglycerate dehydrogenase [Acidimicrobiales bacterium]